MDERKTGRKGENKNMVNVFTNGLVQVWAFPVRYCIEYTSEPVTNQGEGDHQEEKDGRPVLSELLYPSDDSQQPQQPRRLHDSSDGHRLERERGV